MRGLWVKGCALSLFFLGIFTFLTINDLFAKDRAAKSATVSARPWIMVTMSASPHSGSGGRAFSVIKEMSGNPNGKVVHFSQVTYEMIADMRPAFIILGPQGTPWCRYTGETGIALQNFLWTLPLVAEDLNIPILGICGGHQALALAFGGKVGPVRADEDDCMPYTRDRQGGVVPLTVKTEDPIFSGIDGKLKIVESHYDEVKVLPPGFVLLASEKVSRNQIIRHPTRPVYGIQGHPECFHGSRSAGGMLIRNFLTIASAHNEALNRSQPKQPDNLLSLHHGDETW
jgi:GMP synthase (glutamine-hydrolysing)